MASTKPDLRATILQIVEQQRPKEPIDSALQTNSVLPEAARRVGAAHNIELEQALLTQWHELFRTGYLAWGHNLSNPSPPFFHLTEQGRRALSQLSRDPGNPDGYLRHLYATASLNPIAKSYIEEGLKCYVAALYKSAAVMVGASSESMALDLRDALVAKLARDGVVVPKALTDWKLKSVLDGLKHQLDAFKPKMGAELRAEYESYWAAFAQQIRAARNEAGHPASVDPVTPETVHASLLIFPELARMTEKLTQWLAT
jgi:hypothetical protein